MLRLTWANLRMVSKVLFKSGCTEWETPQKLFDKLNEMYGPFNLDPCASDENHKCNRYFTEKENGLRQSWQGHRVFMNPPYGRAIKDWMKKAWLEAGFSFVSSDKGFIESVQTVVVCLIPARTDTRWWHHYAMKADEIILIKKRIKFNRNCVHCLKRKECKDVDKVPTTSTFPSAVVVFGLGYQDGPRFCTMEVPR